MDRITTSSNRGRPKKLVVKPLFTDVEMKQKEGTWIEESDINPEVDDYIKSLFNQSFVMIALLSFILMAFLYLDFTNIVMDFNHQLLGN